MRNILMFIRIAINTEENFIFWRRRDLDKSFEKIKKFNIFRLEDSIYNIQPCII